jgi:hypothetical protein
MGSPPIQIETALSPTSLLSLAGVGICSFADADCSKLLSEQAAMVFKIEHSAHTHALKISVLLSPPSKKRTLPALL